MKSFGVGSVCVWLMAAAANVYGDVPVTPATADSAALEEVIVTARRVDENLQRVPVAVTVIGQEAIDKFGSFSPFELAQSVPGLRASAGFSNHEDVTFNLRGETQTFQTLFPAVIPYFAEMPMKTITAGTFYDLDDVQVLRGPQGVRFGRVTDGGAVLIQPKMPTDTLEGYAETKFGDYGLNEYEGALNIPLADDKILLRGAFDISRRKGYTENLLTGRALDDVHYDSERISATLKPADGFTNSTVLQLYRSNENGTANQLTGVSDATIAHNLESVGFPAATANGVAQLFNSALAAQQQRGPRVVSEGDLSLGANGGIYNQREDKLVVNTTTYGLPGDIQLKNIFGFYSHYYKPGLDAADGTSVFPYILLPNRFVAMVDEDQFSDEFQVHGTSFGKRLDWSLGTYWDRQKPAGPQEQDTFLFGALNQDQVQLATTTSKAVHADGEYDLSEWINGLKLNGGVRYTKDSVDSFNNTYLVPFGAQRPVGICTDFVGLAGNSPCVESRASFDAVTYESGVTYQLSDGMFAYVSKRRGYRPGGFNNTAVPGHNAYQPEHDDEWEVGLKSEWTLAGNTPLRTNIALFHDHLTDAQELVVFLSPGGGTTSAIDNSSAAIIYGAEIEGTIILVKGLNIDLKYAYTDAHFERGNLTQQQLFGPTGACNPTAPVILGFCPFSRMAETPQNQATLGIHDTLPRFGSLGTFTFGASMNYESTYALEPNSALDGQGTLQHSFALVNLDATWGEVLGVPLDISFFMNNLGNVAYKIGGSPDAYLSSAGVDTAIFGPPRMFGFDLKYRFGR